MEKEAYIKVWKVLKAMHNIACKNGDDEWAYKVGEARARAFDRFLRLP